jgi:hypothetical protein
MVIEQEPNRECPLGIIKELERLAKMVNVRFVVDPEKVRAWKK